jgi:hypothetical protein
VPTDERANAGVPILINYKYKKRSNADAWLNERIFTAILKIDGGCLCTRGRMKETYEFRENLTRHETIDKYIKNDHIIIGGDFSNTQIGYVPVANTIEVQGNQI